MPDLNFQVAEVHPESHAAAPQLIFKLSVTETSSTTPTPIHAIALRCQLRLDPTRRTYTDAEKSRLFDLFGLPAQWSQTLRPMLWTHASAIVPAFTSETTADLPVPCTYDFNVAMTKYFDALDDGEVPLTLLFSGTIFYESEHHHLQTAPISWKKEAVFRLPAKIWRTLMQQHYPHGVWICLQKPTLDRLRDYRTHARQLTWDNAIDSLIESQKTLP